MTTDTDKGHSKCIYCEKPVGEPHSRYGAVCMEHSDFLDTHNCRQGLDALLLLYGTTHVLRALTRKAEETARADEERGDNEAAVRMWRLVDILQEAGEQSEPPPSPRGMEKS